MEAYNLFIFKDQDRRMKRFAGQDKVFFHVTCTGGGQYLSYGMNTINTEFESGGNLENLQEKMVECMAYLQDGYHSGKYEGKAGEYEHAATEYPQRYETLVHGLSDESIEAMKKLDLSKRTYPRDQNLFFQILIKDREMLCPSPSQADFELIYT